MINRYFRYTLTLRAPAILSSLGGDPNSSATLPFIPGSAVRGAVARALGNPGTDPERQQEFRKLILDGSVCYLNAYPRAGNRRTLPTPVSFRIDKNEIPGSDGTVTVWDLAAFTGEQEDEGTGTDWPEAALEPVSESFVSIGAAEPLCVSPKRNSRIHQQRDRQKGRAWKEIRNGREEARGTIFVYEYLEPRQEFDGVILVRGADEQECEDLINRVKQYLTPPILLGRSRRSGYGGDADIQWHTPRDREVEGQGLVTTDVQPGTVFRVLLTASYIGRDQTTGQLDPTYLEHEIVNACSGRIRVVRRRWAFEPTGGFNRKWRLEIPQALACAAGSVLVLEAKAAISFSDLLAIEHAGLGERRVEGFGRMVFLQPPTQRVVLRTPASTRQTISLPDAPPPLIRLAEARILTEALSRNIAIEAARLTSRVTSPPTPSLLGRLRTVFRGSPESGLRTLRRWLVRNEQDPESKPELRRPALDQLERCRIGDDGRSLASWLRQIVADNQVNQVKQSLRLDAMAQRYYLVSEKSAHQFLAGCDHWMRAYLIDSVLAALARSHRTKEKHA